MPPSSLLLEPRIIAIMVTAHRQSGFLAMITRLLAAAVALGLIVAFVAELGALADLYAFEFAPLASLLGVRGLFTILVINLGLVLLLVRCVRVALNQWTPLRVAEAIALTATGVTLLWLLQWTFIETPPTVRLRLQAGSPVASELHDPWRADFDAFSVTRGPTSPGAKAALEQAYARIVVNNPAVFRSSPLGATIDRWTAGTPIDPELLFETAYLDSFYGEATSGPVPLFANMNAETLRDVVQVHLPAWLVESSIRRNLAESPFLVRAAGENLGFKLRYALQKSNIDVSSQPFGANTLTNVLMVLQEDPDRFRDVLTSNEPVARTLADAFGHIRGTALLRPYESPYQHAPLTEDYYRKHREHLKRFSRAAYYLLALDFEFATRVQVALLEYRRAFYIGQMGLATWQSLPRWQQNALLAMVQDVYTPSVGHFGYNVYALPEINNVALDFVAGQAATAALDAGMLGAQQLRLWRPPHHEVLWGGAGFQLGVMNELWSAVHGTGIPGAGNAETLEFARDIVWLNRGRLHAP